MKTLKRIAFERTYACVCVCIYVGIVCVLDDSPQVDKN